MPSDRKQLNVRVDEATETLIERLKPAVSQSLGVEVSVSDLVRLGMRELERKYLGKPAAHPAEPSAPTPTKKPRRKKGDQAQ